MHSSFGPDIPRFQEFTEPVRKYRHASLIVKHREEQPEESEDDTVVFGEIDPKTLKKKRKRKRVMNLFGTPELRDALRNNGWEPGQDTRGLRHVLAELFHFLEGRYYVVRLWFLWLDKRIGPAREVLPDRELSGWHGPP